MVRFGQRATPIPESLIVCLRAREDEEGLQNVMPDELKAGSRVRILEGPFAGYEGIFQVKTGRGKGGRPARYPGPADQGQCGGIDPGTRYAKIKLALSNLMWVLPARQGGKIELSPSLDGRGE